MSRMAASYRSESNRSEETPTHHKGPNKKRTTETSSSQLADLFRTGLERTMYKNLRGKRSMVDFEDELFNLRHCQKLIADRIFKIHKSMAAKRHAMEKEHDHDCATTA